MTIKERIKEIVYGENYGDRGLLIQELEELIKDIYLSFPLIKEEE